MDPIEQGVAEQWLFYDRDIGLFRSLAQPGTGVARDQDCGRVDVTVAQLRDQLEPAHARELLVNDEAIAVGKILLPIPSLCPWQRITESEEHG